MTFETVPTLDAVRGLAIHGPTATLFTLGNNHTVQQFDLSPPVLVANKQHPPPIPPPSPPVSVEEQKAQDAISIAARVEPVATAIHLHPAQSLHQRSSESEEEEALSPLQRIKNEMDQLEERRHDRSGARSPSSASAGSRSSRGSRRLKSSASDSSKVTSHDGTAFSYGSSINSRDTASTGTWASSSSIASSKRSRGRGSRLKQEILRSPEDVQQKSDLFSFTRARLDDVPYLNPQKQDRSNWTPADLRRQMLNVIFGWDGDIEGLVQDERK